MSGTEAGNSELKVDRGNQGRERRPDFATEEPRMWSVVRTHVSHGSQRFTVGQTPGRPVWLLFEPGDTRGGPGGEVSPDPRLELRGRKEERGR